MPGPVTRTLTNVGDPLIRADGSVIVGATITFALVDETGAAVTVLDLEGGELVHPTPVVETTDANGEFTTAIWANDRGNTPSRYKVTIAVTGEKRQIRYGSAVDGVGDIQWKDFLAAEEEAVASEVTTLAAHVQDSNNPHGTAFTQIKETLFGASTDVPGEDSKFAFLTSAEVLRNCTPAQLADRLGWIDINGYTGSDLVAFETALDRAIETGAWLDLAGRVLDFDDVFPSVTLIAGQKVKIRNGHLKSSAQSVFKAEGTEVATGTIAVPANQGDETVTATIATGELTVGDLIQIQSDVYWYHDPRDETYKGEFTSVKAIDGDDITLTHALHDTYEASETLTFTAYSAPSVETDTVIFENTGSATNAWGLWVQNAQDVVLKRTRTINCHGQGLHIWRCLNFNVDSLLGIQCDAVSTGYGVGIGNSIDGKVHGGTFRYCRRGVDVSGIGVPSRHVDVYVNKAEGGGKRQDGADWWNIDDYIAGIETPDQTGFGTHGPCEFVNFSNNTTHHIERPYILRGRSISIQGHNHYGPCDLFADLQHGGGATIRGNNIFFSGTGKAVDLDAAPSTFVKMTNNWDTSLPVIIENNLSDALRSQFILFAGSFNSKVFNIRANNNRMTIVRNSDPTDTFYELWEDSVTMVGTTGSITMRGNEFLRGAGFTGKTKRGFADLYTSSIILNGDDSILTSKLVADNSVISVPVRIRLSGRVFVRISAALAASNPMVAYEGWLRMGQTTVYPTGADADITVSNIALEGTTGVDGAMTISYVDDVVYVENRLGASRYVEVSIQEGQ